MVQSDVAKCSLFYIFSPVILFTSYTESIKSFDILRRLKSALVCSSALCSNILDRFDFSDRWTSARDLHPLESEDSGLQQSRGPPEPRCRTRCVWTQQALADSCKPASGFIRGFYKFYIYALHTELTKSFCVWYFSATNNSIFVSF